MFIEDLLGLPKSTISDRFHDDVVSVNNVNCTVELQNVRNLTFCTSSSHALFYFDLANNNIMTMAVLKIEKIGFFDKLRLRSKGSFQCGEYVGNVTFTGKGEAVITYIRENILKAI